MIRTVSAEDPEPTIPCWCQMAGAETGFEAGREGLAISRVCGNLQGLKKNHLRSLEKIGSRRVARDLFIGPELARSLCELSFELNRQIGLLSIGPAR